MSGTRRVILGLLAFHWGATLLLWRRLPDRIPVRSDGVSVPGEWAEITVWSWFGLPTVSLLLVLGVWTLAWWLGRFPLFLGLRGLGRFRRLPAEARGRVLRTVREGLELFALPVVLVFLLVQVGVHETTMGRTFLPWTFGGLALSMLAFSAVLVFLRRRIEDAVDREWKRAGGPPMLEGGRP